MAQSSNQLTINGFLIRLGFALLLVLLSYNPSQYCYYDWLVKSFQSFNVLVIPAGIILVIGWTIYIRATLLSLGLWGLILSFALFGSLIWVLIDWEILELNNISLLSWFIEIIISLILAIGMSWSHIRRKMSGQIDVEHESE